MQLAGYLTGVMGTGEHARQLAGALRTQHVNVGATTLHGAGALEDEALGQDSDERAATDAFADFNLLCANADSVAIVAEQLGPAFFAGRYTIGFWAWEVAAFPERFAPAFGYVDEVWVGSRHVRDAVTPLSTVPVIAIPQPVSLPDDAGTGPPPAGLPDGFRFLFAFDYLSVFERKNPLAAVAAFTRAFAPGSGASLIVKSLNDDHNRSSHERLRAAAASHPDVHLIEHTLPREQRDALLASADCYVSMHRAEGFGYTLAESMWLGKPVIATGYSGNLDFMTPDNSLLVDHRLVTIGPGSDPYPADGVWAEPDVEHAAALMRQVFEHRDEARRRGERASREIRAGNGPDAAGRAMVARLEAIRQSPRWRERLVAGPPAAVAPGVAGRAAQAAAARISRGSVPPPAARFGAAQRMARRALVRLLRPVTVHQGLVDRDLLAAIERLDDELRALRAAQAATLERVADLRAAVDRLSDRDHPET